MVFYNKLCLFFIFLLIGTKSCSQNSLNSYKPFFQQQIPFYQNWLENEKLDFIFNYKKFDIKNDKLVIYLQSRFLTDDSLKVSWENYRRRYYESTSYRLEGNMLEYLSYLIQSGLDSTKIIVLGADRNTTIISIEFDKDIKMETYFPVLMNGGSLTIPIDDINPKYLGLLKLSNKNSIKPITEDIRNFFYAYYSVKSTFFYYALVDTIDSYYNMFIMRISCINKEILTDGYYEYINLKIEVEKIDKNVNVRFNVYGSYASGILCPKFRQVFYTPIGENNFPGRLDDYVEKIKYKIGDFLKK